MTDAPDPPRPNLTPRALAASQARAAREAAALRANLLRRKAQIRARQEQSADPGKPDQDAGHGTG